MSEEEQSNEEQEREAVELCPKTGEPHDWRYYGTSKDGMVDGYKCRDCRKDVVV